MKRKSHFPFFCLFLLFAGGCTKTPTPLNDPDHYSRLSAKAAGFQQSDRLDSAFFYFNKARSLSGISADQKTYAMINMAEIQRGFGDFAGAESTLSEVLPLLGRTQADYFPSAYNLLGIVLKEQRNYAAALKYYTLCLGRTTDSLSRAVMRNNIAVVHMDRGKFATAIQILTPLLQQNVVANDDQTHARILDNLGYSLFKMGEIQRGRGLMQQSEVLRTRAGDHFGLVSTYYHLSESHADDPARAQHYAQLAYRTATSVNSADDRLETLAQLIRVTNPGESRAYSLTHIRLGDSLVRLRQSAKNQFATMRYDDAQTRAQNAALKLEKNRITNRAALFGILLGSVVVIAVTSYILLRRKHKKERIIEGYKAEARLSKRVHDELANDIYHAIAYTEAQQVSATVRVGLLERLDHIYSRARDISRENSQIDTGTGFPLLLRDLLADYQTERCRVLQSGMDAIEWDRVSPEQKIMTYRILQELMVNMKKHSHAPMVSVRFGQSADGIVIAYSDNGVGCAGDAMFRGHGLQNVENRIGAIGGNIIFDTAPGNGFRATFRYPIKK